MKTDTFSAVAAILTAIIGVAILAVILSPNSDTPSVIKSVGNFFSNIVSRAVSPVSQQV